MYAIKDFFGGVGTIRLNKTNGSANYSVRAIKALINVIIPHFNRFPLLTQKRADFELFKSIVLLINNKDHLTTQGLKRIVSIKASMNKGLSATLRESFPDISPVERPEVQLSKIPDPHWLAGFMDGDGCYYIHVRKSSSCKQGIQIALRLSISQHSRDAELLTSFVEYLNCGVYYSDPVSDRGEFRVTRFSDITEKIIPFFDAYPLHSTKALDFADFKKVAELMNNKGHLTLEGSDEILKIKTLMNKGREH